MRAGGAARARAAVKICAREYVIGENCCHIMRALRACIDTSRYVDNEMSDCESARYEVVMRVIGAQTQR